MSPFATELAKALAEIRATADKALECSDRGCCDFCGAVANGYLYVQPSEHKHDCEGQLAVEALAALGRR